MILSKINYNEFPKSIGNWQLNNLNLNKINLLVGKNSTGKSRAIDVINNISTVLINGIPKKYPHTVEHHIEFVDKNDIYQYYLEIHSYKIINEKLFINNELKIDREKEGIGKIFACKENKMIDFQIPENKPAITSRQDLIQYPYLKNIYFWAENVKSYYFGEYLGKEKGLSLYFDDSNLFPPPNPERVVWIYKQATNQFGDNFEKDILNKMKTLGYNLNKLWINPYTSMCTGRALQVLCAMEDDREGLLFQIDMSQGMFRSLSLLIQITYNIMNNLFSTIIIDDIGEGLDFERSSKLIKMLINLAEENENIQLIMSTNDRFVMNNVPLEYWQVIQRTGSECKVYNYQNSKEIFDEFTYTGLNNFDFLATDFINSKWEKA